MTPASPELPRAPTPVGKLTVVPWPTWRFHVAADRVQVLREVVRGTARVAAVDRGDLEVREVLAGVDAPQTRVIPVRDLAEIDVGQDRTGDPQVVLDAVDVVHNGRRGEHPRDLDAAAARRELIDRKGRVAGAEVDCLVRDGGDAAATADRVVGDLDLLCRLVALLPDGDQRRRERGAGALELACGELLWLGVRTRSGKAAPAVTTAMSAAITMSAWLLIFM